MLLPPVTQPAADPDAGVRNRLLGFRVTGRWLARWKRDLARIKADTGISAADLSLIILSVLDDAKPMIRARAIAHLTPPT